MSASAAADVQNPHCIHAIGIGRTGGAYIEALFRTGEIEDLLAQPGASCAALLIDIGDEDIQIPNDYARSLAARLKSRGISGDRFHYESLALSIPEKSVFAQELNAAREQLKKDGTDDTWSSLPKDYTLPQAGQHVPRAIAKGIYAINCYRGERKLEGAMQRFVSQVRKAEHPATVLIAFGLAGGTGSGMAFDLARQLAKAGLGSAVQVVGVGQLSHSGDGEYYNNLAQFMAIEDVDRAMHASNNPFGGGFFTVASEQSWQRLTAYTTTGVKEVRQRFKQMVTNRFVADSFMRFAVLENGRVLFRALRPAGFTGAPHETLSAKSRNWTLFNVAKLSHPGVQVLPGEAGSKWDAVLAQWIDFAPKYAGLKDGFKTDYAEVHIHASRDMGFDLLDKAFKDVVAKQYLLDSEATYQSYNHEFFDALTAYGNIILPGVAKTDLDAFWASQKNYDKLDWESKLNEHAWLIDIGPMLSEPAIRFEGMAGECIWGCACWVVVPYDQLRGDKLPPPNRKVIMEEGIAMMTKTVVKTPGGDAKKLAKAHA